MKKEILLAMTLGLVLISGAVFATDDCCAMKDHQKMNTMNTKKETKQTIATLKENVSFTTKDGTVFKYAFNSKPKLGTNVVSVKQLSKNIFNGKLALQNGMPSMPGAHDSGWVTLTKNKKGIYVAPVAFVMPGDWQIDLRITEGKVTNDYTIRLDI